MAALVALAVSLHPLLANAAVSCDAASIKKLLAPETNATLASVVPVPENGTYSGGGAALDPDFPGNATGLPALCAVEFNVTVTDDTFFSFGMYLPEPANWNNRMMGAGNTGFGGGIDWTEMAPLVHYGFATISTDTGHLSGPNDASWANNAPLHLSLWGGVALHTSVVLGKQVIAGYYGSNATYSYYSACSGGGRQGLKEVQAYTEDFDGVIAGAAPWLLSHLHPWAVHVGMPNLLADPADTVSDAHFAQFAAEVVRQCDPQDGHVDQVVSDPYGCQFDYTTLLCNATFSNTSVCFTTGQLDVLKATYADWTDIANNNSLIWPSLSPSADATGLAGANLNGTPSSFGMQYVDNFLFNSTKWDWHNLNASVVEMADSLDPGISNANSFDLSAFKNRGGKLITYHGLSDPLIPTGASISYYEQTLSTMSNGTMSPAQNPNASTAALDDFYRLFLIPGMFHCSNSDGYAPWYFAAASQKPPANSSGYSTPGFQDASHDIVLAMMAWVENGTAPDSLVATGWHNQDAEQGVKMQRPVCPYPQQAKFQNGETSEASSWSCEEGSMVGFPEISVAQFGSKDPAPTANGSRPTSNEAGVAFGGASKGALAVLLLGLVSLF
jgi:feruloyl esterase